MTFQNKHLLIRINGGFGSVAAAPIDKWSVGLRIGIPGTDSMLATPALITLLNAIHTAASTAHAAGTMAAGTATSFTHVQGARVGEDGKYDPQSQLTQVSTGSPIFGTGTPVVPWNTAHSFGLRTSNPRGYASNGRCYWPAIGLQVVSTTGRLSPTQVNNRISAFRTFINAVNVAANTYEAGSGVCVMSAVGAGTTARVTAIRADDRLDSIERRENDAPSNYVVTPL